MKNRRVLDWLARFSDRGVSIDEVHRRVATGLGAVLVGAVALGFAASADLAQKAFDALVVRFPLAPLALTPALFVLVAFATRRWLPNARGSGIPQIIAAARLPDSSGSRALFALKTGIGKLILTLVMLLGGASVGREGPTVQVGAATMAYVHRLLRVPMTSGVIIAGGAAGVSAAFNTPLAGVAFAIEELASAYEQRVALLVMGAVMIAGLTTMVAAGDYVYFGSVQTTLSFRSTLIVAPVVGVCGGVAGGLFSRALLGFTNAARGWRGAIKRRPLLLALSCGLVVGAVGVGSGGATWGTGYTPARLLVEGGHLPAWFGLAKFVASLSTALSGAPGGIFAPSLAVGAGVGNALSPFFPDAQPASIVLVGMAGYFVGVVRAPLTAVIILMETTSGRAMVLPMLATALIADGVSALICPEKLYVGLSRAFASAAQPEPATS